MPLKLCLKYIDRDHSCGKVVKEILFLVLMSCFIYIKVRPGFIKFISFKLCYNKIEVTTLNQYFYLQEHVFKKIPIYRNRVK